MAFVFGAILFFNQIFIYLADGKALTIGLEKIRLSQNIIKTVVLVSMVLIGALSLSSYFLIQIIVLSVFTFVLIVWLRKRQSFSTNIFKIWDLSKNEIKKYYIFVRLYVRPLVFLMLGSFIFIYFDRWFLQLIGGSVQQGYFGLSDRLGAISIIFTTAMTPLITREFAHAYEENDLDRMRALFDRIKIFIFISSAIGCFLSMQSNKL